MQSINASQQARDSNGQRNTCATCGRDGTTPDPLVVATNGFRIHHSHTTDPRSGYHGAEQKG